MTTTTPATPGKRARTRAALVEDAAWMAQTGEGHEGAARRFGIQPDTLKQNLSRAGRIDLWRALLANTTGELRVHYAHGVIGRAA